MIQHSIKNHQKLNIFEHNENVEKTLKIGKDMKKPLEKQQDSWIILLT